MEIERLARILDRTDKHMVDYNEFLSRLRGPFLPNPDPFKYVVYRIATFIKQNFLTPQRLLKRIGHPVYVQQFAKFLKTKVDKKRNLPDLLEIADLIDLD